MDAIVQVHHLRHSALVVNMLYSGVKLETQTQTVYKSKAEAEKRCRF